MTTFRMCTITFRENSHYVWHSYTYIQVYQNNKLTCTFCEICSHTQCLHHIVFVGYFTAVDSSVIHRQTQVEPSVQTNQWCVSVPIVWLSSSRGSRNHSGNHPSIRVEPLPSSASTRTAVRAVSCTEQSSSTLTNIPQDHIAVVGNRLAIEGQTWNREDVKIDCVVFCFLTTIRNNIS